MKKELMPMFMNLIYSNIFKEKDREYIQELFNVLNEEGINAYVYEPYLQQYF